MPFAGDIILVLDEYQKRTMISRGIATNTGMVFSAFCIANNFVILEIIY